MTGTQVLQEIRRIRFEDPMCFVEEEGTASSLQGTAEVIERRGLPSSLYTDRGSHYWYAPEAGGKVERDNPEPYSTTASPYATCSVASVAFPSPNNRVSIATKQPACRGRNTWAS